MLELKGTKNIGARGRQPAAVAPQPWNLKMMMLYAVPDQNILNFSLVSLWKNSYGRLCTQDIFENQDSYRSK